MLIACQHILYLIFFNGIKMNTLFMTALVFVIKFKNNKYIMASFDIKWLYRNVLLNETINKILDQAFNDHLEYCKFDKRKPI